MPAAGERPVLLFDGVCTLCNAAVDWLFRHDPEGKIRVGALQSAPGRALLAAHGRDPERLESLVLIEQGQVYMRSEAALRAARHLPPPWRALALLRAVPRPLRDALYDLVARHRYRWFGRRPTCRLPTPAERARFLEEDG